MKRILLIFALSQGLCAIPVVAQDRFPQQQGSNYDPPPQASPPPAPQQPVEPDKPLNGFTQIDWSRQENWVKAALLLGAALLALRIFRERRD